MSESLDPQANQVETELIAAKDQDKSRFGVAADYILELSGKARQAMAIGTSLLTFGSGLAYDLLDNSAAHATDTPSGEVARAGQRVNNVADAKAVTMARQIMQLAKSKSPNVHFNISRAGNQYVDEVGVSVTVPAKAGSLLDKGSTTEKYQFYAAMPTPANARYPERRKMRPNEFNELDPRKAQDIIVHNGNGADLYIENLGNNDWAFLGYYQTQPKSFPQVIKASTNPTLPHEQHLTLHKLEAVTRQAELLIQNATNSQATGILLPPFPHVRGEDDSFLPPVG
jgi:hypothetical protein